MRLVHRKVDHRTDAFVLFQNALAEPSVIGAGHVDLDLRLRMGRQQQHRRREKASHIHPHGIHPATGQGDVAMRTFGHFFLVAPGIARHAPGHVLRSDGLRNKAGTPDIARRQTEMPHDRIIHVLEDFGQGLGFVMVAVHITNEEVFVIALFRLFASIFQQLRRVEFLDRRIVVRAIVQCVRCQ